LDELIADYIYQTELGQLQEHQGMGVFPLYQKGGECTYLTLTEALDAEVLIITEIDDVASVPELKVQNHAYMPVLLLDGEELVGAKQNRVLNTTILLKPHSETVIPVSCTEQGRWSYNSLEFAESGNVASYRMRRTKSASVNNSLRQKGEFCSNQRLVWDEIDEVSEKARTNSNTRALQDVYHSRRRDLDEYLESFPLEEGQKGLLVMVNGEVMGLDILSSASAYQLLHQKILKSYALEAMLSEGEGEGTFNGSERARSFLDVACLSVDEKHKSVGYGWDHRLEGPQIVGSALTYQDQVIHMALFQMEENEKIGAMSSYRKRRDFRS